MIYIIMCGCDVKEEMPKHLTRVGGEELVRRTIRLLRQEGIEDIAISSLNRVFDKYGVPLYMHPNGFYYGGCWVEGFYPMEEPACYIFGDVYFSEKAIHTIVSTQTDDVEFFASRPPFAKEYPKNWAEPFAFKVQNQEHFKDAIERTKMLYRSGKFIRNPIAWELWQVLKGTPINYIDFSNYTAINDYTCDVDKKDDVNQWRIKK